MVQLLWRRMSATVLLLLAWTSWAGAQPQPREVLLLYSSDRELAPHVSFIKLFLPELSRTAAEPIDFIEVSLQSVRASRSAPDDTLVQQVEAMLAGRRPDLVVPVGGPAAAFAQRNRQQLFPAVPMLLAGVDQRFVRGSAVSANETAVAVDHEPTRLVENILSVLPGTKTVFVVVGASGLEQTWLNVMKSAFRRYDGRLTFMWANELSFAEMLARSAALPADSAILYAILSLDAKGVPHVEERALTELRAVANAPVFGLRSSQLGLGIVGGPLLSMEDLSHHTTTVALRLLNGESARAISTPTQVLSVPAFDARELRRWNIDEGRLPSGSTVLFREPTLWQQNKRALVAVAGVQVMLVVAFVATLARRRRAERTLRESERRFRLLSNAAPVMMWVADPDGLCLDVNRPWLDFTGRSIEAELGSGWTDSIHPGDLSRCIETHHNAYCRREAFRMEYRLRRHDGEYRSVLDTGAPRFLEDGSFAGYVGSAIDVTDLTLARLALSSLSQRLIQVQEHERAWVARELQDDLCQRMIVLTTQLHALTEAPVGGNDEEIRTRVDELSRQLAAVTGEVFAVSDQLHSSNLQLGLAAATRIFCKELSALHEVTLAVDDVGIPADLPNDVALTLFRVMQEAVRNAVKHSGVREAIVSLRGSRDEIHLEVADQGVGFQPGAVMSSHGLGLVGIRERLSLVHGECAIDSSPGGGTRIRARVPLNGTVR